MNLLQTNELSVEIGGNQVCSELDLNLQAGQVWGVLGRNGIGKTTLLHTLAGLRQPDAGSIQINENKLHELNRQQVARSIGLLLQHHEDSFPSTVLETVLIGRHPHINHWQWESADDFQIARQALSQVNMLSLAQRPIDQLSGGERQRVAIATLITQDPTVFLLDEPNSHLDLNHQMVILQTLADFARHHQRAIMLTLHDINLAARLCDHFLFLFGDGKTVSGTAEDLLNETLLTDLFQCSLKMIDDSSGRVFIPD